MPEQYMGVTYLLTSAPCCSGKLKITVYILQLQSDKLKCCFLKIVMFDKNIRIIRFSFQVVSLANSRIRQEDLPLPILCSLFFSFERNLYRSSMHGLS